MAFASWREGAAADTHVWDKGKNNPVSDIDMAVDAFLTTKLRAILPEAAWLSEESADDPSRLNARLLWLVDPIDGTRDYVRGRSGWCVSVALVADGLPVFAGLMLAVEPAAEGRFVVEDWHAFGPDYDRTLQAWRSNIESAWPRLPPRYDERFTFRKNRHGDG